MNLSVILPVYNTGAVLGDRVAELKAFLDGHYDNYEIILVDDGSGPVTQAVLQAAICDRIQLIRLAVNTGKFGAIAAGMRAASGSCRIFTDADLPYDLSAIPYIEHLINERCFHLVIGDRELPESEYENGVPKTRQILSRLLRFGVRMANTGGIFDTQCGIKGFRGDVASALFTLLRYQRFAGDIEVLYIALKYNLAIRRIPVRLRRCGTSTVQLSRVAPEIVRCCLSLKHHWNAGHYHSSALEELGDQRYWEGGFEG